MSIPKGRYAWFGPDEPVRRGVTKIPWRSRVILTGVVVIMWMISVRAFGQSVDDVAHAIAKTEGFYVHGTKPNRYHNPGDVRRFHGTKYPGEVRLDRFGYVVFKNDAFGWAALTRNLQRIVDGTSPQYSTDPTFGEIAKAYATDRRWGKSVCKILRINPQATLREFLGLAPRIVLTTKGSDDTTLMRLFEKRDDVPELWTVPTLLAQVR